MKRFFEEYGAVILAAIATFIIIVVIVAIGGHIQSGTGDVFDGLMNSHKDIENSTVYRIEYNSSTGKKLSVGSVSGVNGSVKEVLPVEKSGYTKPAPQTITWDSDSKTIEFIYEPIEYTIEYDLNGGGTNNASNPLTYNIESDNIVVKAPTRDGYNFAGWKINEDSQPVIDLKIPTGSIGDKKLIATWVVNSYKYNIVYESTSDKHLGDDTITKEFGTTNTVIPPDKVGYQTPKPQEVVWDSVDAKTIKFVYTPINYQISYSLNGGSLGNNPINSYTIESSELTLPIPTKSGYSFAGWSGSNGTQPQKTVKIASGSTGDKQFTANWDVNSYKLKFDVNGGSAMDETERTLAFGAEFGKLPTPSKLEHNFVGWFTKPVGGEKVTDKTIMGAANQTIYAQWSLKEYTAKFDGNGGTNGTSITKGYNQMLGTLPASTRTGYTFTGWFTKKTDGEQISVTSKMPSGGATFYAHWDANEVPYKVFHQTQELEGVNYIDYNVETLSADSDMSITPDVLEIKGFTSPTAQTVTVNPNGTTEVIYRYERNRYNLEIGEVHGFKLSADSDQSGQYLYDQTIHLNGAAENGYRFVTWTSNNPEVIFTQGEVNVEFKMPALASSLEILKVTPQIATQRYSITYDLDGGTLSAKNPVSYDIETETFTLNEPTKLGYTFIGWTGSNGDTPQKDLCIEKGSYGNKTFKANYQANTYTLNFDANGGTVSPTSKDVVFGQAYGELPTPAREGHTFAGWFTDKVNGSKVTKDTLTTSANDVTIYAHWTKNSYTVTVNYVYESGDVASNPKTETILYGDKYSIVSPTVYGYSPEKAKVEGTMGAENVTHTVTYKPNTYTYDVIFKSSGGKELDKTTVSGLFGSRTTITPIEKTGYITPNAQTVQFDAESKTVEFIYNLIPYSITYQLDGGTLPSDAVKTYNIESGVITLPIPSRSGYKFLGWKDVSVNFDDELKTIEAELNNIRMSSDITLTLPCDVVLFYKLSGGPVGKYFEIYDESGKIIYTDSSTTSLEGTVTLNAGTYKFSNFEIEDFNFKLSNYVTTIPTNSTGDRTFKADWEATTLYGYQNAASFSSTGTSSKPSNGFYKYDLVKETVTFNKTNYDDNIEENAPKAFIPTSAKYEGYCYTGSCTAMQLMGYNSQNGWEVLCTSDQPRGGGFSCNFNTNKAYSKFKTNCAGSGQNGYATYNPNTYSCTGTSSGYFPYQHSSGKVTGYVETMKYFAVTGWGEIYNVQDNPNGLSEASQRRVVTSNDGGKTWMPYENVSAVQKTVRVEIYPKELADGVDIYINDQKTNIAFVNANTTVNLRLDNKSSNSFVGWTKDRPIITSAQSAVNPYGVMVTDDVVYYANFVQDYTVTFDANGGTVSPTSRKYKHNEKIGDTLPTPTRSGYVFLGWYDHQTGGNLITSNKVVTNNMTVYAQWQELIDYTYNYSDQLSSSDLYIGRTYNLPEGYVTEINSYFRNVHSSNSDCLMQLEIYGEYNNLIAKMKASYYVISEQNNGNGTFSMAQGGDGSYGSYIKYKFKEPTKVSKISVQNGSEVGQYQRYGVRGDVKMQVPATRSIAYEQQEMKADKYFINYDLNEGMFENLETVNSDYIPSKGVKELPIPVREGYEFVGWLNLNDVSIDITDEAKANSNNDFKQEEITSLPSGIYQDIHLKAIWTKQ